MDLNKQLCSELFADVVARPLLCMGRVVNLCSLALQAAGGPGAFVEFGCHSGRTAALLTAMTGRTFHLYDSFCGLPAPGADDAGADPFFKAGSLLARMDDVAVLFAAHGLPAPMLHPGWFCDLTAKDVPGVISFAHLDGDLYDSIYDSLALVYPRLAPGGICVIDDYGWDGLPGVAKAVDAFMRDKPEAVASLATGRANTQHAMFTKKGA